MGGVDHLNTLMVWLGLGVAVWGVAAATAAVWFAHWRERRTLRGRKDMLTRMLRQRRDEAGRAGG